MLKKNPVAKSLMTRKYKPRIVKAKKGKGSFKRKKLA
jgi:stalled ribosome alternative rescue factor ArfA